MDRRLLTANDEKEGLSVAYVKALATRAGFVTSTPDTDRDSVDMRVQAGGAGDQPLICN